MTLREKLINESRLDWLDVGIGRSEATENFKYLDLLPKQVTHKSVQPDYFQLDIVNATNEELSALGKYDLVRSQHVIEHLGFEEGLAAIKNCAKLIKIGGYLLMSAPDLRIHIERYYKNDYAKWSPGWLQWAQQRVPEDAPPSTLFSMYAHSTPDEPHLWCYDAAGLIYQINRSGEFTDVKELTLDDPLAEEPFTHNRDNEDVCVLAVKK